MKKPTGLRIPGRSVLSRSVNLSGYIRSFLIVAFVVAGGIGVVQRVGAETADSYCDQYPAGSSQNACIDGLRGASCDDYAITFDEATANICRDAAQAQKDGLITDKPTFKPENQACKEYSGDLLTACNGGVTNKECNPIVLDQDPELVGAYNACAKGAGIDTIDVPSEASNPQVGSSGADAGSYKNAINSACRQYSNSSADKSLCLQGAGLDSGGVGTPGSIYECFTNNSGKTSKDLTPCFTGAMSGQSFLSALSGGLGDFGGASNGLGGAGGGSNQSDIMSQLNQTQGMSQYINMLHALGPNAGTSLSGIPDNSKDYYINGAGKKQPIKVVGQGAPNGAAIIFFNGGAWHNNDHSSDQVAAGECQNEHCPTGGGATDRGFTSIDCTYRLGSSGVYYMFEDVMRCTQHVITNASLYGIDPAKIAVWGDSAGGSLSMRVAGSGKSGAKAAVGWSAPTNGFTALFHSFPVFILGMDHSTCVPTDLAGMTNFTSLLTGGSGNVAQYGQGLSSNDFSSLGIVGMGGETGGAVEPISLLTDVLTAGQYALQTGTNAESISMQLQNGGISGMSGGLVNLTASKFTECLDNFKALSPALFASPDSPPSFMAGFDNDQLVGASEAYGMRDKLQSLGIPADTMIIHGDKDGLFGNHLGYDARFVCASLNWVSKFTRNGTGMVDCKTNQAKGPPAAENATGGNGGNSGKNGNNKSDNKNNSSSSACDSRGDGSYSAAGGECVDGETARKNCIGNSANSGGAMYWDNGSKKCMAGQPELSVRDACQMNSLNNPDQMYWDSANGICTAPPIPKQKRSFGSGAICTNGDTGCIPGAYKNAPVPGPF